MQITAREKFGLIKEGAHYDIQDGLSVIVGRNDVGKSTLLQLAFKNLFEKSEVGSSKICLLLPERIFIDSTIEINGSTFESYNREIYDHLRGGPLPYHNVTHNSQNAFKLLIGNFMSFKQLSAANVLLQHLGFSELDFRRNQPIIDEINVGRHGSGLRTVLPIIAVLTDPSIEYVLIDEPEQSLEPIIQKYLRDLLYEASEKNGKKIIITTHSHLFLNRKNLQMNYIAEKNDSVGISIAQVKTEIEMYDLVYRLLGSSPDDLFFPKNFLIVEGASDQEIVEKVIELMGIDTSLVKVISARSVSTVNSYRTAFEACLTPYVLRNSHYKDKVVVLIDKANEDTRLTVDMIKQEIGDRLFTLPTESLEEYIDESLYIRAERDKNLDIQKLEEYKESKDYVKESELKKEISEEIAKILVKEDLNFFQEITTAISKAMLE